MIRASQNYHDHTYMYICIKIFMSVLTYVLKLFLWFARISRGRQNYHRAFLLMQNLFQLQWRLTRGSLVDIPEKSQLYQLLFIIFCLIGTHGGAPENSVPLEQLFWKKIGLVTFGPVTSGQTDRKRCKWAHLSNFCLIWSTSTLGPFWAYIHQTSDWVRNLSEFVTRDL